jgi:hypothetical protein
VKTPNPDSPIANLRTEAARLSQHVQDFQKQVRLARGNAWDMAVLWQRLLDEDFEGLRTQCRAKFPQSADPVKECMDNAFAPLKLIGQDPQAAIRAVREGKMTREQFVDARPFAT